MLTISLRCKPKKTETCTSPCELVTFLGNVNQRGQPIFFTQSLTCKVLGFVFL